jgi:hypothetical protein
MASISDSELISFSFLLILVTIFHLQVIQVIFAGADFIFARIPLLSAG